MELANISLPIRSPFLDRRLLRRFLNLYPLLSGPRIIDFQPWSGHAGSLLIIVGRGFSDVRSENIVTVGGHPAVVISAEENRLIVISSNEAETGAVTVALRVEPDVVRQGPRPFTILDTPSSDLQLDGPPIFSIGADKGWLSYSQTGASYFKKPDDDLPDDGPTYPVPTQEEMEMSNGQSWTTIIVIMPCYPSDQPEPSAAARQVIVDRWNQAAEFWRQVSHPPAWCKNYANMPRQLTASGPSSPESSSGRLLPTKAHTSWTQALINSRRALTLTSSEMLSSPTATH